MVVRELLTVLGFQTDEKAVKSYDGAMKDLGKSIAVVTGAAAAAGATLFGFIKAETASADASAKLGRQLGLTATQIEALQFAEGQTGADGFTASLGNLQSRLAEATRGTGRARTALEAYGIQALDADGKARSLTDVLPDIADSMQTMAEGEQADLARQLGLSPQSLLLLREGASGLERLTNQYKELGGGIDQADAESAELFNDTMAELGVVISSIRRTVAIEFLPVAQQLVETIKEWFIANREIVRQRMVKAIEVISSALRIFWNFASAVLKVIDNLAQTMGGWVNVMKIAGIALGIVFGVKAVAAVMSMVAAVKALSIALWANPIGLIIAAVTALGVAIVLLVEDIYHWVSGNESAIGRILGSWDNFKDKFIMMWEVIKSYMAQFWQYIVDGFNGAIDGVVSVWAGLRDSIKSIIDSIIGFMPAWLIKGFQTGASWVGSAVSKVVGSDSVISQAIAGESASSGGGMTQSNNMQVGQVSINVPAGSTQEQAQAIEQQVRRQMQQEFAAANRNQTMAEG